MPGCGERLAIAMPSAFGDQRGGLRRVDRSADHPTGERVQHDRAIHLALPGVVLGDVGDPQLVQLRAGEEPVDQITGGRGLGFGFSASVAGQPLDPGTGPSEARSGCNPL